MFRLGLTGSIATGKTTALNAFAGRGYPVFSSDDAVHALYEDEAVGPVGAAFPGVVRDQKIDRPALAAELVDRPGRLSELERIVHPLVRKKITDFLDNADRDGAQLAIADIPLLFESGHDYGLDAVAVTWCDRDKQRQRALARPGMNVEKLQTMLARQMPQDEKKRRATWLIDTNRSIADTDEQVADIAGACLQAAKGAR